MCLLKKLSFTFVNIDFTIFNAHFLQKGGKSSLHHSFIVSFENYRRKLMDLQAKIRSQQ